MSRQMRAAVLHGKEDVRIEQVPVPELAAGEVLIKVEAALTCGTDVKVFRRGYHARMIRPPAVFGHEMAGTIAEIGPGVEGFERGARVVAANSAPCGICEYCRAGRPSLCEDLLFWNGAYAEYVRIPARVVRQNLLTFSAGLDFHKAAMVEPLACAIRGIADCAIHAGQAVAVIGSGPLGLMLTYLAKRQGAHVVAVGRRPERLLKARQLGADETVSSLTGDLDRQLLEHSPGGRGYEVVIEAVGLAETSQAALRAVRKGGLVNLFGGCAAGTEIVLDAQRFHYQELRLTATFHHTPASVRQAFRLIAEAEVDMNVFLTGSAPMDDLPGLLREMASGKKAYKMVIHPGES